jgi:hypothetical protein
VNTLQKQILAAHHAVERGETGARERLEDLQTRFRLGGYGVVRTPAGATCSLIERGATATRPRPHKQTRARPRPVEPRPEIPELRVDAISKLKVKVRPGALRGINDELDRASPTMLSCIETGGSLYAGQTRLGVLELIEASGPGEDGKGRRLPGAVRISVAEGYAIAKELRRIWQDENIGVCGSWHTHPCPAGIPSEQDRISALRMLDDLQERRGWRAPSQYIDLIVFPDARAGWELPGVIGWATRRLEWDGAAVTERVRAELA